MESHAKWVSVHPSFEASERLKGLLLYLVRRAEQDPGARVSQSEIAIQVLGYDESFDPAIDAHVRIEVSRLRKVLEFFYAKCGDQYPVRIDIPKGGYKPELLRITPPCNRTGVCLTEEVPIVMVADLWSNDATSAELAYLISAESLHRCQLSPLVRAGSLSVGVLSARSESDCLDAARQHRASFVVCGRVFHIDGANRTYLTIFDTSTGRAIWRDMAHSRRVGYDGTLQVADSVANRIATEISDPILGSVPIAAAANAPDSPLAKLLKGYGFISSQDVGTIQSSIDAITSLQSDSRMTATGNALLADMHRVGRNMCMIERALSLEECLDLSETAVNRDYGNTAADLSLGYTLLSAGDTRRAGRIGQKLIAKPLTKSLAADARLLTILCGAEALPDHSAKYQDSEGISEFFIDELSRVIPILKRGDVAGAAVLLGESVSYKNFWMDIFKASIYGELRETKLAERAVSSLRSQIPNIEQIAHSTVAGFFPDHEFQDFLLDGLDRSGLKCNREIQ